MHPDPLVTCPWLSDDPTAFKKIPQAHLFSAVIGAGQSKTVQLSFDRRRGSDLSAESPAKREEERFVSDLIASGLLPWFTAQLEDIAGKHAGLARSGWWSMLGLSRDKHIQHLKNVHPAKPGDFDLILGPPAPHPLTAWLTGVEFKRLTIEADGTSRRHHRRKLLRAVEQAEGMLELGFNQAVIALIISIAAEPEAQLPYGLDGSEQRDEIERKAVARVARLVEEHVPKTVGVMGILWDAAPGVAPTERSKVSLYKIRRPPPRRVPDHPQRMRLSESLGSILEETGRKTGEIVRACPSCPALTAIRPSRARSCPHCGIRWGTR